MEIIYVSMTVLPENSNSFKDFLQNIAEEAIKLQGCLKYDWFNNPEDSTNFVLYAEFDTEYNYYMVYKKSQVLNLINQQLFPLLLSEPIFRHFKAKIIESHNV